MPTGDCNVILIMIRHKSGIQGRSTPLGAKMVSGQFKMSENYWNVEDSFSQRKIWRNLGIWACT